MPQSITVSWAEMKYYTNTTMKNESSALNSCEAREETPGSSLLELSQQLEGYFPASGDASAFLRFVKSIFVRNYNPITIPKNYSIK